MYALFEELECNAAERVRAIYTAVLEVIPHKKFTFAKIWLLFAQFEIRQKNLQAARKILVSFFFSVCFSKMDIHFEVKRLGSLV